VDAQDSPHLPTLLSSTGSLVNFKRSRKPLRAGDATNCISCPIEPECQYSANKIYVENGLLVGNTGWPLSIVVPDIEEVLDHGMKHAQNVVMERLAEDYTPDSDQKLIDSRGWYGRCVWEADNDVCDDQIVTLTWDDDFLPGEGESGRKGRGAKTAVFHMIAYTEAVSTRRTRIYGTRGELVANGRTIEVFPLSVFMIYANGKSIVPGS
jgi:hypothetical protein